MFENEFAASVRQTAEGTIFDLKGDLTKQAEEAALAYFPRADEDQPSPHIILNFINVPYINSAGIALLIRWVRAARNAGCQTFAFGLSLHYQKLFRMVGLTEYMMIYPDEYSVLQRLEDLKSADDPSD